MISHAETIGQALPGFIPAAWETTVVPTTPLPTVNAEIDIDTTPALAAWDPNSRSPEPLLVDSGAFV